MTEPVSKMNGAETLALVCGTQSAVQAMEAVLLSFGGTTYVTPRIGQERVLNQKVIRMNASHLTVISPPAPGSASEPLAERIKRLQSEAQQLARDHVTDLERALERVAQLANEISMGGDAYPIGARDICRRLAEDSAWRAATLEVIMQKN